MKMATLTGGLFACVAILAGAAPAQPPGLANLPRRGLVAYWPADGDANDAAGKNHGKLMNGATFAPGRSGKAFKLDDGEDCVDFGNPEALRITGDQTIALWVCPKVLGDVGRLVFKCYGGECSITVLTDSGVGYYWGSAGRNEETYGYLRTTKHAEYGIAGEAGRANCYAARIIREVRLRVGQWTHLAVVRDMRKGEVRWYVDGREAVVASGKLMASKASELPFRIGKADRPAFRGLVDEVAVWDRALSAEEIAGVAAATDAGESTLGEGLAAYWPADGDANDAAGKNHGKLMNGATFAPGRSGKAFKLGGEDDYVDFGNAECLRLTGDQTMAMWIRPERLGVWQEVLAKGQSGEGRIALLAEGLLFYRCRVKTDGGSEGFMLRSDAKAEYTVGGESGTPWKARGPGGSLKADQWAHIAFVRDLKARKAQWYLDGRPVAEAELSCNQVVATGRPLLLGRIEDVPVNKGLRGLVDDVAIWNRPLSAEEIQRLFETTSLSEALRGGAGPAAPFVERLATTDRVALADGQVLMGTVQDDWLTLRSTLGEMKLETKDLAGLARGRDANSFWLLLDDGQAVVGTLAQDSLRLKLTAGSTLTIPLRLVKECGRRMPADANAPARVDRRLVLRDGQRLNWCHLPRELTLRTAYGLVELAEGEVAHLSSGRGGHRAQFANGTVLHGTLAPEMFEICTPRPPMTLSLRPGDIRSMTMGGSAEDAGAQAVLTTRDGDVLIGQVANEKLTVRTPYGDAPLPPGSLPSLTFDANDANKVVAKQWDGMVLRGTLAEKEVSFQIGRDGPVLKVPTARGASITRTVALPPPEAVKRIEKLIAQLGAESHRDREAAHRELEAMGKVIIPLLKPHLQNSDVEVRHRIQSILEKLDAVRSVGSHSTTSGKGL